MRKYVMVREGARARARGEVKVSCDSFLGRVKLSDNELTRSFVL